MHIFATKLGPKPDHTLISPTPPCVIPGSSYIAEEDLDKVQLL